MLPQTVYRTRIIYLLYHDEWATVCVLSGEHGNKELKRWLTEKMEIRLGYPSVIPILHDFCVKQCIKQVTLTAAQGPQSILLYEKI